VETLPRDPEGTLKQILLYHVVSGMVMAADVVRLASAKTVLEKDLAISARNGVKANDANVIAPEIGCSNGVCQIIDSVLILQVQAPIRAPETLAPLSEGRAGPHLYFSVIILPANSWSVL
jgi:hypothetical protein